MDFNAIKLKIASPEDILSWSYGEVTKPETINYRTQRPEKDGLFSERIFGPTKDWECYCGKYRKIRYKGVVCDKCGVEVTRSIVRRERMGHLKLAAPVAHIWFLKTVPSRMSLILDVHLPKLEKVIYYVSYMVTAVNEENKKRSQSEIEKEFKARKKTSKIEGVSADALKEAALQARRELELLKVGAVISESEFHNLAKRFGDVFEAGTGAEAIRKIMEKMDLDKEVKAVEEELVLTKDAGREKKLLVRLKILRAMIKNNMRPEWMVMNVLPILPPDLRPMVALDGGRYATSDLNDLYRRVINRNNRLKKLIELKAPDVITVNEKRMLQEAVDALIDNSARFGTQQLSSQRRPLRSLADMLKGKQGRFRQNLLGKRVDYSGRSVIVVGPELKLDQCGIPKKMALELFKPFVINKILDQGLAHNIRSANRLIEQAPPEVWAILEEVIGNRKVLLNRAPTLHRLGVQAFRPLLIEDLALRIPPMVCVAFNADFDGDQMAVHLPLSDEAQEEAEWKMLSSRNLLKPATGDPIVIPTNDIVLGIYYLTKIKPDAKGAGKVFASDDDALLAYEMEIVAVNAPIRVSENGIETSCGRIIFNSVLPPEVGFINEMLNKKMITRIVENIIQAVGTEKTKEYLDAIKNLGFEYATRSGITWSMSELSTPKRKPEIVERAEKEEAMIWEQYEQGLLTYNERRIRIIGIWDKTKAEIAKVVPFELDPFGSVYSIIDSGSRGSWAQPTQMMGMKGLVQNPKGETIELPVKSSLREGFNPLEYFISTHGARKGSTDTALKTASAGYLTRRLVDVSQDLVIREDDCGTKEGIEMYRADGSEFGHSFAERLFSRTAFEDIIVGRKTVVRKNKIIDRDTAKAIEDSKLETIKVRSPITCKTLRGVCSKCYGLDLGHNREIAIGEAVGIIAAQSIGEPGTQLTMRTFHTGGIAGTDITHGLPRVEEIFEARVPKGKAILSEVDGIVDKIEDRGLLKIISVITKITKDKAKKKIKAIEYPTPRFATIFFKEGDEIKKGDQLTEGPLDLRELFALRGARDTERYIVKEVQRIYASEGASINNKHIEVIARQMFARLKIKEAGDTDFVPGEVVEKSKFFEVNREVKRLGGEPAKAQQMLMGVTKVALSTESFLSSASFQETPRVLVKAATEGKSDRLRGLKENVIIGRLIPVGKYVPKLKSAGYEPESKEEEE
ncbi:DNA-directed RNA polymerase subunit beta' [Candidatus Wolfebacteria bacterium RIFCSPLOWO2_01_FULL_45_19]|uniref:DNA-directed RNA polymerase subunit beta' n=1 Tax=Candidatus Wolfebacteria bacterium RIFCSPLOWO2_01_FULL_45_19 TaxID=1802557 RepID=A0A1F8DSB3_9BACT|nr:MAG: DNA-directed RNA polymerase subunit beta' [Parcubacteria group bacterium GW2011_GWB1_45_9]OGM90708.1 MAG: DNA-directed RNA polymerase subunit beta' [Candidatus Wolfebacteria bacterium RIFCSPLOWO2_01_FULL_45_19]